MLKHEEPGCPRGHEEERRLFTRQTALILLYRSKDEKSFIINIISYVIRLKRLRNGHRIVAKPHGCW